jgi:hypothetical protein
MPPARVLHDATLEVLKALDTYALPYIAAFRYRALERMPLIEGSVLLLKAERELAVLNAAIEDMAGLLRHGSIAETPSDAEGKGTVIRRFLDQLSPFPAIDGTH